MNQSDITDEDSTSEPREVSEGFLTLSRDKLLVACILCVGIAGSGIARRVLGELGYHNLGVIVYIGGYAGMIFLLWYGWIRTLNIQGPIAR